ncbi:ABC transporter ATP-binding protein [Carboxydothermus hydrogenoformans]|uniref:ABC transporter, ATP-binding protein n=1 Tax=Carboxydothermus hydrogenoformans (strain ATCC BAA-161 / DSM 6008 / Z-2901) TaxID=246194 RepID=Q3AFU5_CARHZ|nr:ATP-binding cassette domain-containing protein [Carboxydothermus hydrogenoformans]ABB15349.1 ABC transporter, ATP-binding protein [Carboxydothermus hydrogenoformans Z-2901]
MSIIVVDNVKLNGSDGQVILDGITFTVEEGDFLGVLGPSGAGKSSLFRLLNRLLSPTSGEIYYRGKNIKEYDPIKLRREIGYVLQRPYLFGQKVLEDLTYPFRIRQEKPDMELIYKYLAQANLKEEILAKKPTELSGGEAQRISLIRTLLVQPRVLLLDEVTSALDLDTTRAILDLILKEKEEKNLTVLAITHNLEAFNFTKVLYLDAGKVKYFGEGKI